MTKEIIKEAIIINQIEKKEKEIITKIINKNILRMR
jgi:hypothetical protein